ncbi:GntR family transcriptional regulator [Alicyclobacillus acidoterrestris]|uniref:GntR family transcriptional regulator n=1 Tax=Alicyclobacillus acidoterrestris (strain ATCC 49025 / DSM 3922 / CIP 106132 / NCIMB 13137 / GD3B) TaxID=1356854 RepID=T0BYD7_ALIAG|nr:GntR family transcriptional regulator [Alicyclobacillus acidoterrestris]EPZ45415.1 hypothetical protein N007_09075 [Alicyclobacillus acidoterrestris ATCC 49025]UNO48443.1 GntR family transcriptional regulator [Alicyclobacillus acidoterrestris]
MINRDSDVPIYQQLKDWMMSQIESGLWKEGDTIQPERELAHAFGVNRLTVRKALADLVAEGWLDRRRGVGTFVTRPQIQQPLHRLTSFSDDIRAMGMEPSSRVLKMEIRKATPFEAYKLRLHRTTDLIIELRRLRLANDIPIGVESAILPFHRCKALTGVTFNALHSLYHQLRTQCGIELANGSQIIEASTASEDCAEILDIQPGDSILKMQRTTVDVDGEVVEWVTSFYRADRYRFRVELPIANPTKSTEEG